jgi:magnesium transporter
MIEAPTPESAPLRMGTAPHCVEFREGRRHGLIEDLDAISDALQADSVVWLDLVDPSAEELALLQREFHLHPLAIEDAQTPHERPKIQAYDGYLSVIVHPVTWEGERLVVHELSIFAGKQYLITIDHTPRFSLDEVERRWHTHDGSIGQDSSYLLYTLLDTIVDGYFPISDRLEEWINDLQAQVFDQSTNATDKLREIFVLKQDVHNARRAVTPMREIIQPIVRGDFKYLDRESLYYRDVYDHAVRVIDQLDSARDYLNSALDILLSMVANRQNEVSKQLAIIATIFLPLTYITGFFGQNFGWMVNNVVSPQIFWGLGVGSQVATVIVLFWYFRFKKWF